MAIGRQTKRSSTLPQMLLGILFIAGTIWLCIKGWDMIVMRKGNVGLLADQTSPETCKDQKIAYRAMQRLVLQKITTPRSAQFPPREQILVRPGAADCAYVFTAYVQTQDPYGANLTTDFVAGIAYDFAQSGWRLTEFEQRRR